MGKQEKRSPVEGKVQRQAGESGRKRLAELLEGKILLGMAFAGGMWVVIVIEWIELWAGRPRMLGTMTIAAGVVTACLIWTMFKAWPRIKNEKLGADGEVVVSQMLERLRAHGYEVFHDIDSGRGNIDHVVVGPGGVFVLETKARSIPNKGGVVVFDGEKIVVNGFEHDRNPIRQVRAEAQWVRSMIREACGIDGTPRCIVVYPGWFTDTDPDSDVWVLNSTRTVGWIKREWTKVQDRDVQKIAAVLRGLSKK